MELEITLQGMLFLLVCAAALLVVFKILKSILVVGILAVLAVIVAKYLGLF